jgi:hypothetical protein
MSRTRFAYVHILHFIDKRAKEDVVLLISQKDYELNLAYVVLICELISQKDNEHFFCLTGIYSNRVGTFWPGILG